MLKKIYGAFLHSTAFVVVLGGLFLGAHLTYRFFMEPTRNDWDAAHQISQTVDKFIAEKVTDKPTEALLQPFGSNLTIDLELSDSQVQTIASSFPSLGCSFGPFKSVTLCSGRFTHQHQDMGNGVAIESREFNPSKSFRIRR